MSPQHVERKLAAILVADVVGYSRLVGTDEEGTIARLRATRDELIDPSIARHNGRIVKTMGDGLLIEFTSVVDAVRSAAEVQRAMAERNTGAPGSERIEFRVGINLGDVVVEGDDIMGDGVNVAARLEGLAEPGGVCISGTAFDQVRDKLDVGYEHLGEQKVKNIARPVRVYKVLLRPADEGKMVGVKPTGRPQKLRWAAAAAIILGVFTAGGVWWWQPWLPGIETTSVARVDFPLPDKPSIAVLPFDNLSGDESLEHFADGLSEDITASLAKLPRIFVIARNSSFTYKGRAVKVQQVAEELGVKYVLEGSIQKSGEQLRITSQLIDGITGGHVWTERYDRKAADLFAVKDAITLNILSNLEVALTGKENARLKLHDTDSLEAWLAHRESAKYYRRFTKETNLRARELAQAAIELDPDFSAAHSRLAMTHMMDARLRWVDEPKKSLVKAEEVARRALQLDPTNSSANNALAMLHLHKREYAQALAAGERATFLAPNDGQVIAMYGLVLQKANEPEKSIQHLERALRLNPFAPYWAFESLGESYVMAGRFQDAIAPYKKALKLQPKGAVAGDAHLGLALAYDGLGRDDEAKEEIKKAIEVYPAFTLGYLEEWQQYQDKEYSVQWLAKLRRLGLPE